MTLDWPAGFERTPADERENTTKFSVPFRASKSELRDEMDRLGVGGWTLDDVTGSGGDPGVVLRWRKDGTDFAVACDAYTTKRDNLRTMLLWVRETRKRGDRPVETGAANFAAAQLPSGDEDAVPATAAPHNVLGVAPDASDREVEAAFREQVKDVHPDYGGSEPQFNRVKKARDEMLGGDP